MRVLVWARASRVAQCMILWNSTPNKFKSALTGNSDQWCKQTQTVLRSFSSQIPLRVSQHSALLHTRGKGRQRSPGHAARPGWRPAGAHRRPRAPRRPAPPRGAWCRAAWAPRGRGAGSPAHPRRGARRWTRPAPTRAARRHRVPASPARVKAALAWATTWHLRTCGARRTGPGVARGRLQGQRPSISCSLVLPAVNIRTRQWMQLHS